MDKKHLYSAAMILGVVAAIAYVQRNLYEIPVIGAYLPK